MYCYIRTPIVIKDYPLIKNSDDWKFDTFYEIWKPTTTFIKKVLNLDLDIKRGSREEAESFITEMANKTYTAINRMIPSETDDFEIYKILLNYQPEKVKLLKRAIIENIRAEETSNTSLNGNFDGVNLSGLGRVADKAIIDIPEVVQGMIKGGLSYEYIAGWYYDESMNNNRVPYEEAE